MSRTDTNAPITFSQLMGAEVVDESGRRIGHVHDVRVVRDAGRTQPAQTPEYRVEGLIVGRAGLRARLGLAAARHVEPLRGGEPVRWEDVVALAPGRVTIR
jgi:sporulation protein YlmC with PRC-barrel domain